MGASRPAARSAAPSGRASTGWKNESRIRRERISPAALPSAAPARALGPPKARPPGKFFHALSGTRFSIQSTPARMVQRIVRQGATRPYTTAYALGSGPHAYTYLIHLARHLVQ